MRPLLVALLALLLTACSANDAPPGEATEPIETPAARSTPAIPTSTPAPTATPLSPIAPGGSEADGELALAHLRHIALEIGERVAGSSGEVAVAEYVMAELESYGYDVELQPFEFEGNRFPNGRVSLGETVFDGIALNGSVEGEASGRLIYAGLGAEDELAAVDATGAIVVTDRGVVTFGDKYRNAVAAGAAGLIVINDVEGPLVAGTLGIDASHPVVGVSQEQGVQLPDAIELGMSATVNAEGRISESVNVLARVNGARCDVLVGGHHDSVPGTQGANDNASGVALVLEIARAMAADGLDERMCFATFGGEESGLFGSRVMAADLRESGEPTVMVNLDVTGRGLPVEAIGDADLIAMALRIGEELGIETIPSNLPPNAGSDHLSFSQAGGRVLFFASSDFTDIHTPRDTFDRIEPEAVAQVLAVAHATVRELYLELAAP